MSKDTGRPFQVQSILDSLPLAEKYLLGSRKKYFDDSYDTLSLRSSGSGGSGCSVGDGSPRKEDSVLSYGEFSGHLTGMAGGGSHMNSTLDASRGKWRGSSLELREIDEIVHELTTRSSTTTSHGTRMQPAKSDGQLNKLRFSESMCKIGASEIPSWRSKFSASVGATDGSLVKPSGHGGSVPSTDSKMEKSASIVQDNLSAKCLVYEASDKLSSPNVPTASEETTDTLLLRGASPPRSCLPQQNDITEFKRRNRNLESEFSAEEGSSTDHAEEIMGVTSHSESGSGSTCSDVSGCNSLPACRGDIANPMDILTLESSTMRHRFPSATLGGGSSRSESVDDRDSGYLGGSDYTLSPRRLSPASQCSPSPSQRSSSSRETKAEFMRSIPLKSKMATDEDSEKSRPFQSLLNRACGNRGKDFVLPSKTQMKFFHQDKSPLKASEKAYQEIISTRGTKDVLQPDKCAIRGGGSPEPGKLKTYENNCDSAKRLLANNSRSPVVRPTGHVGTGGDQVQTNVCGLGRGGLDKELNTIEPFWPSSTFSSEPISAEDVIQSIHKGRKAGKPGRSRSGLDGVPTAHVSPSFATPKVSGHKPVREASPAAGLSRHGSQESLGTQGSSSAHEVARLNFDSHLSEAGSVRWGSCNNINNRDTLGHEEFLALPHDANPLFDQSQFCREAEDVIDHVGAKSRLRNAALAGKLTRYPSPGTRDNALATRVHQVDPVGLPPGTGFAATPVEDENMHGIGYPTYSTSNLFSRKEAFQINMAANPGGFSVGSYDRSPLYGTQPYTASHLHARTQPNCGSQYHSALGQQEYDTMTNTATNTVIQPSSVGAPSDHFASDLTSWQQKHQEQLKRQQVEVTQPSYMPGGASQQSSISNILVADPHRLDAVKRAADNIIKEKDNIIEKQKLKLLELERQSKESEVDRVKEQLRKQQEERDTLGVKLQEAVEYYMGHGELQYENASIKAKLTEYISNHATSCSSSSSSGAKTMHHNEDLEKKLGASEYQVQQLRVRMNSSLGAKESEIKQLQEKISDKDALMLEWKDKFADSSKSQESLQRQVESMQRYFQDLPTADEHDRRTQEIKSLKDDKVKYKAKVSELEKKLSEATKGVKSREALIESLEQGERNLREQIGGLEGEKKKLQSRLKGDRLGKMEEEIQDLKFENGRLQSDCGKAKKLLESKHKKLQQIDSRSKGDVAHLQERLGQEEATVLALREETKVKDEQLRRLRASFKEVGQQNQDLMEKNLMVEDRLRDLEHRHSSDQQKAEQRLLREMGTCFAELQSLVQICVQRAEGKDPNLSMLLGVKSESLDDTELDAAAAAAQTVQSLKTKMGKVRELRSELDRLRTLVSNKYAEDLGDNLSCTTQ